MKTDRWGLPSPRRLPPATSIEPVWQSIVPKIGYICLLPAVAVGIVAFIVAEDHAAVREDLQGLQHRAAGHHPRPDGGLPVAIPVAAAGRCLAVRGGAARLWRAALRGLDPLGPAGHGLGSCGGGTWPRCWTPLPWPPSGSGPWARPFRPWPFHIRSGRSSAACGPSATTCRPAATTCNACIAHGLLGKTDLALLQAARRNGNLAWAAGEMADSNRRRFIYRVYALLQVIFPLVIVGYGLLMAAISVAMFLPLGRSHCGGWCRS